jgi:hypothetical protein
MKKLTAILLITALTLALTGCGETDLAANPNADNRTAAITETPGIPPNIGEMRLNTDFLAEFGMTLSELEEKYGSVSRGTENRLDIEGNPHHRAVFTYFFGDNPIGYDFMSWDEVDNEMIIDDGTARVKEPSILGEFRNYEGPVSALFLGMDDELSVLDIPKIPGLEICLFNGEPNFNSWYGLTLEMYVTSFLIHCNEQCFSVMIRHEKESIIEPNAQLNMGFPMDGRCGN